MQLVEQQVIDRRDPRDAVIDEAAFTSKNLSTAANDEYRQAFIHEGRYLNDHEVQKRMQSSDSSQALPANVSQQVLLVLDKNGKGLREALQASDEDSSTFLGRPKRPKYTHKTEGRTILVDTIQAISRGKDGWTCGIITPSMLAIEVQTQHTDVNQVRIVPRKGCSLVEVVDEQEQKPTAVDPERLAGGDRGLNHLVALTSNKPGFVPVVVHGRGLKSCNQFSNKRRAHLQTSLGHPGSTPRMEKLTNTRNRRVDHDLHTMSRFVLEVLVAEGIGTLVIGKNDGWKQEATMGKRNNQQCVQLPHARFIAMLTSKAELAGMTVRLTEES